MTAKLAIFEGQQGDEWSTLKNSQPKRFRLARNAKLAQIFNRTGGHPGNGGRTQRRSTAL